MNILGLQYGIDGCHDTSAAIVSDGVLLAAAEEERFTRRKHDSAFPSQAIEFCLRQAGVSMDQIDLIAFPEKPFRSGPDSYIADLEPEILSEMRVRGKAGLLSAAHKRLYDLMASTRLAANRGLNASVAGGFAQLRKQYSKLPPVRYYDHHRAHAAAAYLTSGFDGAAIATIDFSGGPYSTAIWKGDGNGVSRIRAEGWYNSLGELYWKATQFLGFGEFAEGKTMGLAPYGDPKRFEAVFASAVESNDESKGWPWFSFRGWPSDEALGCTARTTESPLDEPYPSVAAATQLTLEASVQRIVRGAIDESNSRKVCLGGGVALNCSSNGALLDSGASDEVWVFPGSSDSGLSVGAALLCAAESGEFRRARLEHAYWGPEFSNEDCAAALAREPKVSFRHAEGSLKNEIAESLTAGMVIGICRGRMEFGPRALGNRSIVADPRRVEIRDRVNRIKNRELWRPLAPSVLAERTTEFFTLSQPSPFMLFRAQVEAAKRRTIPAVVHVDGSARPQTVTREQNAFFYDLISAFNRRTGVPILLNTSFNDAGEPIVCTPADAIKTFLRTGLDLLVLGDFIVRRSGVSDSVESGGRKAGS